MRGGVCGESHASPLPAFRLSFAFLYEQFLYVCFAFLLCSVVSVFFSARRLRQKRSLCQKPLSPPLSFPPCRTSTCASATWRPPRPQWPPPPRALAARWAAQGGGTPGDGGLTAGQPTASGGGAGVGTAHPFCSGAQPDRDCGNVVKL